MQIKSILKKFAPGIALFFSLLLIENLSWIAEPTLFGNLIDALINKSANDSAGKTLTHIIPLILWIGLYLLNSATGSYRRRIEPRIFQKIYVEIVMKIAALYKEKNADPLKAASRAQLSQEYITFIQYRVPEIVEQLITVGGAVFALYFFDWRISVACLTISFPLVILYYQIGNKLLPLQGKLHDEYENIHYTFRGGEISQVQRTFSSIAYLHQQISRWSSLNFGIMRFILLIIFLVVLYVAIDLDDFSTGAIYSIVAYLWAFVTSVEYIPELIESRTSLIDLNARISSVAD